MFPILKKQIPVFIEEQTEDWPANDKDVFNNTHSKMKTSDYIALLESKPTNYSIFLYNLTNGVSILNDAFKCPKMD